ncbi:MAG: OmpA family protein [Oligoflexia bacterium]|nr:OmpA family protein [Oligoflexia bacterium]
MKNLKNIALLIFTAALVLTVLGACSTKGSGTKGDGTNGLSEADLNAQREGRFGEGGIPLAEGEGLFRDINFDYDSARIGDQARQSIEYNVEILKQRPEVKIQLEGHCDERGTAEYNLALGDERSKAVKDVLLSYGIQPNRLETISYGEEVPLDPAHDEMAFAKNRRVHFSGFSGSSAGNAANTNSDRRAAPSFDDSSLNEQRY